MHARREYDIIVVGAGCAGPAAAKKAAELGLTCLLIEKAGVPGEKNVSGTCLNAAALIDPDLRYLLEGPVEREIRSIKSYQISGERTTIIHEIPSEGIILLSIRRDVFDAWHTEMARKAGADVLLAASVVDLVVEKGVTLGVVTDTGDRFLGRVTIDAGGVNSTVGRKAGLIPKRRGTNMVLYVTVNVFLGEKAVDERWGDCIEYYLAPGCQHKTWPWIFPKREVVTLGTGGYMTGELLDGKYRTVNDYMQNFMELPPVKSRIDDGRLASWGLHLEFDEALPERVANNLILTGEAGGFVIPFLGEGMVEAFFSGIYAAQAAARGIGAGDTSKESLEEPYGDLLASNAFLQSFRYVASVNKEAILSKKDEEITEMMQNVVLAGGFITNAVHTKWLKGAEEGNIELVREAADFLQFIKPYRQVSAEFEKIYRSRRRR
jgi:electron transfer flavoprotein-quinone oxidoreductase